MFLILFTISVIPLEKLNILKMSGLYIKFHSLKKHVWVKEKVGVFRGSLHDEK